MGLLNSKEKSKLSKNTLKEFGGKYLGLTETNPYSN